MKPPRKSILVRRIPWGRQVQPEMGNGSGNSTKPRTVVSVVGNVKLRRQSDRPAITVCGR